jgi:hypothetical protein
MVSEDQKELFLVRRWSIALLALLLVGCEQELLKEKVDLLEAVMFTVEGIENNIQQQHRFEPVRRTIVGQTIMYTSMGRNSYGFSDDSMNKKVGDSSFVRYTEKISSLENCVFRKESLVEFSKGNSKEDFSVHDMGAGVLIINLNNAYKFDLDWRGPQAFAILKGPAVVCDAKGECVNDWEHVTYPEDYYSYDKSPSFLRREKALAVIKNVCPGKAY